MKSWPSLFLPVTRLFYALLYPLDNEKKIIIIAFRTVNMYVLLTGHVRINLRQDRIRLCRTYWCAPEVVLNFGRTHFDLLSVNSNIYLHLPDNFLLIKKSSIFFFLNVLCLFFRLEQKSKFLEFFLCKKIIIKCSNAPPVHNYVVIIYTNSSISEGNTSNDGIRITAK